MWAALAIVGGSIILALAGPRLIAAFWLTLQDPVFEMMHAQAPVSRAGLHSLVASRELALDWVSAGSSQIELAAALLVLASTEEPGSPAEEELREQGLQRTEAGLALAPADPRAWMQLAWLMALRSGPSGRSAAALDMSLRTGPYETPASSATRLRLALLHWPWLESAAHERVARQIVLLWDEAPEELVALALDPVLSPTIMRALAGRPQLREELADIARDFARRLEAGAS